MKFLYNLKINGKKHRVLDDGGTKVYDPPLPEPVSTAKFDEMCATRTPPGALTDDVFLSGIGTLDQQIKNKRQLDEIVKAARKRGYNPRPTDFYNPNLANGIGDPAAFLNHGKGLSHIKRVAEARGASCETETGRVLAVAREPESDPHVPKVKLAPKIVERIRRRKIKENPDLARKDQNEIRAEIVQQHGSAD